MKTSMRRPLALPSCFVAQSAPQPVGVLRSCSVASGNGRHMPARLSAALAALTTRRGGVAR